jgi:hypothetical protein
MELCLLFIISLVTEINRCASRLDYKGEDAPGRVRTGRMRKHARLAAIGSTAKAAIVSLSNSRPMGEVR